MLMTEERGSAVSGTGWHGSKDESTDSDLVKELYWLRDRVRTLEAEKRLLEEEARSQRG